MSGRKLKFPYEIRDLDKRINKEISKNFSDGLTHLVQVGPQKMLVPSNFASKAEYYYNFPLRNDDIIVMGYPRSGTTMTQELIWLLLNNVDFSKAAKFSLIERVPLIESRSVTTPETIAAATNENHLKKLKSFTSSAEILSSMTQRRVMKTHLHLSFLPENLLTCGCKIIYVARNPKDVVVSLYHLQRTCEGWRYCGSFETFLDYFMSDMTLFAPYWTHLKQGWEQRLSKNVRFIFYEDFIENRRSFIKQIADFINIDITPEVLDILEFTLKFENFKKYMSQGVDNEMNHKKDGNDDFIRKGKIGGWKMYFTEDMNTKFDKWIQQHLDCTNITFPPNCFNV